jgi:hypothetical protein
MRRPNKELKLTKPGTIEASQLNSSVVRTIFGAGDARRRMATKALWSQPSLLRKVLPSVDHREGKARCDPELPKRATPPP